LSGNKEATRRKHVSTLLPLLLTTTLLEATNWQQVASLKSHKFNGDAGCNAREAFYGESIPRPILNPNNNVSEIDLISSEAI
jgi:hypothetical protein